MGSQCSMPAACKPFISLTLRKASLWVSGNLYQRRWQQKNTSHVFKGDTRGACLNVPVLHLSPLAFRYAHLNLFIRGSLAPTSCGWPYRQTGREHFTSSHTHPQIWVVGCGQGDAQWDRSFRSNVSLEYNQPDSQESIFPLLRCCHVFVANADSGRFHVNHMKNSVEFFFINITMVKTSEEWMSKSYAMALTLIRSQPIWTARDMLDSALY